ncbi:MAG: hypothetical protein HY974_03765 [Candidatus Kerfeldbacteria bacterium]|nr:hypothetical protein [Candidatus Kerfeldbacteria bacterium]
MTTQPDDINDIKAKQLAGLIRRCKAAGGDGLIRNGLPSADELQTFSHIEDREVAVQLALQQREQKFPPPNKHQ